MLHDLLHELPDDTERVTKDILFWASAHIEGTRVTDAELPSSGSRSTVKLALSTDASSAEPAKGEYFV
jgi:hypothetical protein